MKREERALMSVPDGRVAAPVWDALAKIEVSGHPSPHCEMRPATPGASSPITEAWSASDIQPSFSPWRAGPSGWGAAWWGAAVRSCHGTVQIQQMLHRHEPDCAIRKHLSYDVQLPPDAYLRPIPIVTCRGARVRGSKAEKEGSRIGEPSNPGYGPADAPPVDRSGELA